MQPEVHADDAAVGRLADLGLTEQDLMFALLGGDAEARMWTRLAPPVMAGMARWGKTNELLRIRLVPHGWSADNPGGLPRTISPGGDFALVATAGDAATGLPGDIPSTKYPKGTETIKAIGGNVQMAFDFPGMGLGEALFAAVSADDVLETWLLLYHVTDEQIFAELSLANGMSERGFVNSWSERILLRPIELTGAEAADGGTPESGGDAGVTVTVERR